MSNQYCNDPNCIACTYDRKYPNDPNRFLVFEVANCMTKVCATFQRAQTAVDMAEAMNIPLSRQQVFNEALTKLFAGEVGDHGMPILHVLSVAFSLIPNVVIERAKEMYLTNLQTEGETAVDPALLAEAQDDVNRYLTEFLRSGANILSGQMTGPRPTHSAPETRQ